MRRFLAVCAVALTAFLSTNPQAANTWGTDMSDLWWNPAESGWGANVAHQGDTIFMTLFVYGVDNRVRWYVASDMAAVAGGSATTFRGSLYETTGPYLGGAFNPASVSVRQVGTATLTFSTVTRGNLTYSVDGVDVAKAIERQTFRWNNLTGSYVGSSLGSATGCGANSGIFEDPANFSVNHSASAISVTMTIPASGLSCTYSGTYRQSGRMGLVDGSSNNSLSCSNGARGTFQVVELEAGFLGFVARYSADYGGGCTEIGRIGGMKR